MICDDLQDWQKGIDPVKLEQTRFTPTSSKLIAEAQFPFPGYHAVSSPIAISLLGP
jgi:hypothetical protein